MARPVCSGAINIGLVTVPVKLYSATSSHRIDFHQFRGGRPDGRVARQRRGCGRPVEDEQRELLDALGKRAAS